MSDLTTRLESYRNNWIERDTIRAGLAKRLIAAAMRTMDLARPSKINPALTNAQALEIFSTCINPKPDDEILHSLIAANVLRTIAEVKRHWTIAELVERAEKRTGLKP